jgi:hypothetical protein
MQPNAEDWAEIRRQPKSEGSVIRPNQPHESRLEPRETAPDATEAVCPWHQVDGRERRLRSAPRTEISADLLFQFGDIRGEFGRELAPDCWIQGGS